ncbi:hypothetical protein VNI00_002176 [Paramarasmius palmivorus]|uniref:N-acetyltransferase domain-containing protein n=1 Tax=Paramarasmius palmivorus TaxID=297713 RepID=A0AAW0E4D7_9AGAR
MALLQTTKILYHQDASEFLSIVSPHIQQDKASVNIVLAHAWRLSRTLSSSMQSQDDPRLEPAPRVAAENFWLTIWRSSDKERILVAILSSVCGELGRYPIFLWSKPGSVSQRAGELESVAKGIVVELASRLPPIHVFSVFGGSSLVEAFASAWSAQTGFKRAPSPYYHATLATCSRQTLVGSSQEIPQTDIIRIAEEKDVGMVAMMCGEFAKLSVHFPLSADRAALEAERLISHKQLYVYEHNKAIASICAVTRETQSVVAITKVYTSPQFRKNGYAERLVRYVTERMLANEGKNIVVLYVGLKNSARRVYERIGFSPPIESNAEVLEVGFVGTEKGHW